MEKSARSGEVKTGATLGRRNRWTFSLAAIVAACLAAVVLIECVPGVVGPLDLALDEDPPFLPRFFNLWYAMTAFVIYVVIQEHMLLVQRFRRFWPAVPFTLIGLAALCGTLSSIPDAALTPFRQVDPAGVWGSPEMAVVVLVLMTGLFGGLSLLTLAPAYLLRRFMVKRETGITMRFYIAALVGMALLVWIMSTLVATARGGRPAGGDPLWFYQMSLFVFLYGPVGLVAGGLARLLTPGKERQARAMESLLPSPKP